MWGGDGNLSKIGREKTLVKSEEGKINRTGKKSGKNKKNQEEKEKIRKFKKIVPPDR